MRQTRSAGSNAKFVVPWSRKLFSRNRQSVELDSEDIPAVPKIPSNIFGQAKPVSPAEDIQLPIQGRPPRSSIASSEVQAIAPERAGVVPWPQDSTPLGEYHPCRPCVETARPVEKTTCFFRDSGASFGSSSFTHDDEPRESTEFDALGATDASSYEPQAKNGHVLPEDGVTKQLADLSIFLDAPTEPNKSVSEAAYEPRTAEEQQALEDKLYAAAYACPDSSLPSYAPSEDFSPGITSNTTHSGPMSPLHLSQPETPIFSDFGDDFDRSSFDSKRCSQSSAQFERETGFSSEVTFSGPPSRAPPPPPSPLVNFATPRPALGGFQGYSLPNSDHASALTIRKLPSIPLKHSINGPPVVQQGHKQELIHSWNDGSKHLLDDLGYLGELII